MWVPQHDNEANFADSLKKLSQPFSNELWIAIAILFLVYVLLSAMASPQQYNRHHWTSPPPNSAHCIYRTVVRWIDSFNTTTLEFLGRGINAQRNQTATPAQKWLNIGFAILSFLVVAAYTANLAALFTIHAASQTIRTMEQAIATNTPLCASTVLEADLRMLYPNAQWIFKSETKLIQRAFDKGLCQGIVDGWIDIRADPHAQKWYCEKGLVRVGDTIVNKPMAFPATSDIAAGLSHWIVKAREQGILFENFVSQVEALCPLEAKQEPNQVHSDPNQLTITTMLVPMALFVACSIIAILIHTLGGEQPKRPYAANVLPTTSKHKHISVNCMEVKDSSSRTASETEEEMQSFNISMAVKNNRRHSLAMRRPNDIDSVHTAEETMEELMAYQRGLFLRIKHLSRQEERIRQDGRRQQLFERPILHMTESEIDDLSSVGC